MIGTLFSLRDETYQAFQARLIPNIDPESIIGVRTPELRRLSKTVDEAFRADLPHRYFEENQIHAFSLETMKDFDAVLAEVERFLPFVDNWATCDQLRPRAFAGHTAELLPCIRRWLRSDHPYTVRFGMEMLMCHYLGDAFREEYPRLVAESVTDHYYVRMMAAWYFATALALQYDAVIPYISEHRLDPWVHNKAIQKAVESFRITPEQKEILKKYRIK